MAQKKKPNQKADRLMSIMTFVSIGAIIWEISLFRKTFINVSIPLTLFIGGGFILFLLFRNKIRYYVENAYGFFLQAFHGIILFGGLLMFFFMALNFYIPTGKIELVDLKVIKTGKLSKGRHGCGDPYAIVEYHGFEKQLIFPCSTNLDHAERIKVHLQKGLLGFLVVKDTKLVNSADPEEAEMYMKILVRAEAYYSEGNSQKAIELYERAVRLKPSDQLAKIRLKKLKSDSKMTRHL
ncbi:tetratricopeptide repeat protein [Fluviicola taffensis]|uniref:tetratricopeptide repeat protein n=1 Tax=Fluviicola taffensis TaxID=191579 RepID=UPI003137EF56